MKCCAPVLNRGMMRHRADRSSDPRCKRTGLVWIKGPFGRRLFCRDHARIWRDHYEIVSRIRSL